jgi:hypothetical protein
MVETKEPQRIAETAAEPSGTDELEEVEEVVVVKKARRKSKTTA